MLISDWSSDVFSSDLQQADALADGADQWMIAVQIAALTCAVSRLTWIEYLRGEAIGIDHGDKAFTLVHAQEIRAGEHLYHVRADMLYRSEEHTSELQSLMRISYAVFCLKKKSNKTTQPLQKTM